MAHIEVTTQVVQRKRCELSFPWASLGIKIAIAIIMTPEITRETFENGPGEQIGLTDYDSCATEHAHMRKKYSLTKCPNCGRNIEKAVSTADKSQQATLSDF